VAQLGGPGKPKRASAQRPGLCLCQEAEALAASLCLRSLSVRQRVCSLADPLDDRQSLVAGAGATLQHMLGAPRAVRQDASVLSQPSIGRV